MPLLYFGVIFIIFIMLSGGLASTVKVYVLVFSLLSVGLLENERVMVLMALSMPLPIDVNKSNALALDDIDRIHSKNKDFLYMGFLYTVSNCPKIILVAGAARKIESISGS